jgi:hypothetical protein
MNIIDILSKMMDYIHECIIIHEYNRYNNINIIDYIHEFIIIHNIIDILSKLIDYIHECIIIHEYNRYLYYQK